jgi:hypothetical protein
VLKDSCAITAAACRELVDEVGIVGHEAAGPFGVREGEKKIEAFNSPTH